MQGKTFNGLEKLLTIPQSAEAANVSRRTVSYWMATGGLPYCKLGRTVRIIPADLEQFILKPRIGGKIDAPIPFVVPDGAQ